MFRFYYLFVVFDLSFHADDAVLQFVGGSVLYRGVLVLFEDLGDLVDGLLVADKVG
jgi:hypothetical protein